MNTGNVLRVSLGAAALVALLTGASLAGARGSLSAELAVDKGAYVAGESVFLRLRLVNDTGGDLRVLKWRTPFAGVYGDIFDVERDGQPVEYVGRLYKFGTPGDADFLRLPVGGSLETVVDLTSLYAINAGGRYRVRYRSELLADGGALRGMTANDLAGPVMGVVEFVLDAPRSPVTAPAPGDELEPEVGESQFPTFQGCAGNQKVDLLRALSNGQKLATEAYKYVSGVPATVRSPEVRYGTWFGAYDAGRYALASIHFLKLKETFELRRFKFVCNDCNDAHLYAFVYAGRPYGVHLCPLFWTAPWSGVDTRGGTLLHEASHFWAVASTKDLAYGTAACQALADSNPAKAVTNADSHEYYAETGPALTPTVAVTWTVSDGCSDGKGLVLRFFDRTRFAVFPGWASTYRVAADAETDFHFSAPQGAHVCIGAQQDPAGGTDWCAGLNGDHDASYSPACCADLPTSGAFSRTTTIVCQ